MIVAGIGYNSAASADAIVALVRRAMDTIGATAIDALAVPAFKRGESTEPEAAAGMLAVMIVYTQDADMRAVADRCPTEMAGEHPTLGKASVAEAAALAAAGHPSYLLLPRISSEMVTCALAEGHS